jgi:hypothetical protein
MQPINIVTIVDVVGALSKGALRDNLYMADNGWYSERKGTADLATACYPGQRIGWVVHPIDVQTPVLISAIRFLNIDNNQPVQDLATTPGFGGAPHWCHWSGFVPCYLPPGLYGYRLQLQLGRGSRSTMSIDTPALNVLPFFVGLEQHHEPAARNSSDDR